MDHNAVPTIELPNNRIAFIAGESEIIVFEQSNQDDKKIEYREILKRKAKFTDKNIFFDHKLAPDNRCVYCLYEDFTIVVST